LLGADIVDWPSFWRKAELILSLPMQTSFSKCTVSAIAKSAKMHLRMISVATNHPWLTTRTKKIPPA
jgi:hypothetical protein